MEDRLLILDIDETLIHSVWKSRETPSFDQIKEGFPVLNGKAITVPRPHLQVFLKYAFDTFKVAVWTSASVDYAEEVLDNIGVDTNLLQFFYTEKNCTPGWHYSNYGKEADIVYFKKLSKLRKKGYDLDKVLIIDDKRVIHKHNYGNLIQVKPFYGQEDDELLKLIDYLDYIKYEDNFRKLNKRGWNV